MEILAGKLFEKRAVKAGYLWYKPNGRTRVSQVVLIPRALGRVINENAAAKAAAEDLKAFIEEQMAGGRIPNWAKLFKISVGPKWGQQAVIIDADTVAGQRLLHKFHEAAKDKVATPPRKMN